ncbi:MAG TPA: hypothetical protein VF039_13155 [Longimicrobiales bacterium]
MRRLGSWMAAAVWLVLTAPAPAAPAEAEAEECIMAYMQCIVRKVEGAHEEECLLDYYLCIKRKATA